MVMFDWGLKTSVVCGKSDDTKNTLDSRTDSQFGLIMYPEGAKIYECLQLRRSRIKHKINIKKTPNGW